MVVAAMGQKTRFACLGSCLWDFEGYELLLARQNGWFVILYSYEFNGTQYSGEFRKWLLFSFSSEEAETEKVMKRYPRGSAISLRVDPHNPNRSVADR
jgi:hypothetical protein